MKWTPPLVIAGVLLVLITLGALCFLPHASAWAILGQLAAGALGVLS